MPTMHFGRRLTGSRRAWRPCRIRRIGRRFDHAFVEPGDVDGHQTRREAGAPVVACGGLPPEHEDTAVWSECRALHGEALRQDAFARPVRMHDADGEVAGLAAE